MAAAKFLAGALTATVVIGLSIAMAAHPAFGMAPWLYNIVTAKGVIGPLELSGNRPTVLPLIVRGIISALVLMTSYFLAARLIEFVVDFRRSLDRLRDFFAVPDSRPIIAIFGLIYFGLMVIRAGQDQVFDRYCLPLIPCLGILLLRRRSLAFAWPLVVIYAVYALASTQDNFALAAAPGGRRSPRIPRRSPNSIAGGFEYDFYTQLEESGRVNRYGMTNPTRPFNDLEGYTPALKCKYRLEFPRSVDTEPSPYGEIDLSHGSRRSIGAVYIDQFKTPWWLDPNRPANSTIPLNFETDYEN